MNNKQYKEKNLDNKAFTLLKEEGIDFPNEETLDLLQCFFKTFGDATRLKILFAIRDKEICVCHLAQLVKLNQTTLSHQLAKLYSLRLVKKRKEGKMIFYSLDDEHVLEILGTGFQHILEKEKKNGRT